MKPTIALVAHGVHDRGGMERALYELVARSGDRYRFVVVASELDERLRAHVDWQRVRVPMRPIPLKLLVFGARAGLKLRRIDADLVHTMGAIVPNRADLATVQFCFAGIEGSAPGRTALHRANTALTWALSRACERWCYRPSRLRRLGATAPGVVRELARHYPGIDVALTPNGVDTERFRPDPSRRAELRRAEGVHEDDVVALFVGGDWERKGLRIAIDATAAAGLPLWVVGRGDATTYAAPHVRFFGARDDAERFFAAADVFLLPTLYETFSLVSYEAAASGLPVVATRVHGVEELVGEDAGVLVDRAADAFAAALRALAADPERRARLGATGRRRAAEFDWSRSVEAVEAVYRSLLAEAA